MYQLMIVEDEDLLREGMTTCVNWSSMGFSTVRDAEDGQDALHKIQQSVPDVVVTDIKMPHMNGIELLQILSKEYPQIKTIIISGHDDFAYAKEAMKAGVSEYLLKPLNLQELRTAVQSVVEQLNREKNKKLVSLTTGDDRERYTAYSQILLHNRTVDQVRDHLGEDYYKIDNRWHMVAVTEQDMTTLLTQEQDYMAVLELDRQFEAQLVDAIAVALPGNWQKWITLLPVERNQRILCLSGRSLDQVERMWESLQAGFESQSPKIAGYSGQIFHGLADLPQSLQEAQMACRKEFASHWQSVLDINAEPDPRLTRNSFDASGLIMEMKVGSQEGIASQLQQLLHTLYKEDIISYFYNVMILHQLFLELIQVVKDTGGSVEEVVGNPMEVYQNIISKQTRQEMIATLAPLCITIAQYYQQATSSKVNSSMHDVEAYIAQNFAKEDLTMKDVAEHVFLSVSYLNIILKKEKGKTFIEFLTDYRMAHAKRLLLETEAKAYEIAEQCGYSSAAYFSTVFKGFYGESPSGYRKNNQKQA